MQRGLDQAQNSVLTAQDSLMLALAERAGRGAQESVKIGERLVNEANAKLRKLINEKADNAIVTQAAADVVSAATNLIRAQTALAQEAKSQLEKIEETYQKNYKAGQLESLAFEKYIQDTTNEIIKSGTEKRQANLEASIKRENALRTQVGIAAPPPPAAPVFGDNLQSALDSGATMVQKGLDKTNEKNEASVRNLSLYANAANDAFGLMFETIGSGGDAFSRLGQGISRVTAQLAKTKAAENIAFGVENLAKSFGFIALGNVASTAAAKTAAVGHFKTAALWGALGGVAAGASGMGGAGGGGMGGAGGLNDSSLGSTEMGQGTITLNLTGGSILDMSNIDTQRSFLKAIETLTNKRAIVIGA